MAHDEDEGTGEGCGEDRRRIVHSQRKHETGGGSIFQVLGQSMLNCGLQEGCTDKVSAFL